MSDETTLIQLTLFAEDSPARICPLPESGRAWLESGAAFGTNSIEFLQNLSRSGWLLRTSPAFYQATVGGTLPPFFAGWSNSGMACAGGYSTLNISEWPKDAAVCSLSEVLETDAPHKYYLSARAARGILRRAEKRGRDLPPMLQKALEAVAIAEVMAEPEWETMDMDE